MYSSNSNILNTYDTKSCPFYKIYPKRVVDLDYELVAVDDIPFYGFLQKKQTTLPTTSGLGDINVTFQYIYDSNNYPTSVLYKDLLLGDAYKGVYYY